MQHAGSVTGATEQVAPGDEPAAAAAVQLQEQHEQAAEQARTGGSLRLLHTKRSVVLLVARCTAGQDKFGSAFAAHGMPF